MKVAIVLVGHVACHAVELELPERPERDDLRVLEPGALVLIEGGGERRSEIGATAPRLRIGQMATATAGIASARVRRATVILRSS